MNPKIIIIIAVLIVCSMIRSGLYAQASGTSFTFPQDNPNITNTQTYDYQARDEIHLKTGFHYKAVGDKTFRARINENLLFPVQNLSTSEHIDVDTRTLSQSCAVGTLPGSVNVSPTGAATYNIPIELPPGTGGMIPNLSIDYNSLAGSGILGVGWNLGGISAITRVSATIYHDERHGSINFDTNDRFALDGNRLIETSGNYGEENTKYGTEIETFSEINSIGTSGNGPHHFIVITKDGKTIEYGNDAAGESRIKAQGKDDVLIWLVNKIIDLKGNFITFSYYNNGNQAGEYRITEIKYTGNDNAGIAPYNSIKFSYDSKTDSKNTYFVNGSAVLDNALLRRIQIFSEGACVKEYFFKFKDDNHLESINLKGSDGISINPTIINWGDMPAINNIIKYYEGAYFAESYNNVIGDFNGDSYSDLVNVTGSAWSVYQNKYGNANSGTLSGNFAYFISGDLDDNGKDDIVKCDKTSSINYESGYDPNGNPIDIPVSVDFTVTYSPWISTNTSIINFAEITTLSYSYTETVPYIDGIDLSKLPRAIISGDFDGDSKQDFVLYSSITRTSKIQFLFLGIGLSSEKNVGFNVNKVIPVDFNGDGKTDVMVIRDDNTSPTCKIYEINDSGNLIELYSGDFPNKDNKFLYTGDFNGDGKTDIFTWVTYLGWYFGISTGKNIIQSHRPTELTYIQDPEVFPWPLYFADFNGDGKTDILRTHDYGDDDYTNFDLNFCKGYEVASNKMDFTSTHSVTHIMAHTAFYIGDFNGDGQTDLMQHYTGNFVNYVFILKNLTTERMYAISNGMDVKEFINYKELSHISNYKLGNLTVNPLFKIRGSMQVVTSTVTPTGTGTNATTSYTYVGATLHKQGKGFLGFDEITAFNDNTSVLIKDSYGIDQTYFFPSLSKREIKRGGTAVSTTVNTNSIYSFGSTTKRIFPYITKNESTNELTNQKITTTYNYGSGSEYLESGNLRESNTDYNGEGEKSTHFYYTQAGSSPYYGLIYKTTEDVFRNNTTASFLKTTEYQYDNGFISYMKVTPGTTVTSTLDACGNPESVSVSGAGASNRTTINTYDGKKRFIVSQKNPLNQNTEFSYDSKFGKVTQSKDIAGLISSFAYDGFGNLIQSVDPDGAVLTYNNEWEGTNSYKTTSSSPGTPTEIHYYDHFSREYKSSVQGFDGTPIIVQTAYNEKGQVWKKTLPYKEGNNPKYIFFTYNTVGRLSWEYQPSGIEILHLYTNNTVTTKNFGIQQVVKKTIDAFDKVTSVETSYTGGLGNSTITYHYNSMGLVTDATTNGSTVHIEYDDYGNKLFMTEPVTGTTSYNFDAFGELRSQTDVKGTYNMDYDLLGRIKSISHTDFGNINYTYDTEFPGKLTSEQGFNGVNYYNKYNSFGQTIESKKDIQGEIFITSFTYDNLGRLKKTIYPSGFATINDYNSLGYMNKIMKSNNSIIWNSPEYNAFGQITQYAYGNGKTTVKTYDNYGNIQTIVTNGIQSLEYSIDAVSGKLTNRYDNNHSLSESFGYDGLSRLTTASVTGGISLAMQYDAKGNILSKSNAGNYSYLDDGVTNPYAVTRIYNGLNNFPAEMQHVTYTAFNRPATIEENNKFAEFTYDPGYSRAKMIYKENNILKHTKYYTGIYEKDIITNNGTNNYTRELNYITSDDGLIAIMVQNNGVDSLYYIYTDHLGSITAITDDAGNLLQELSYDAWGKRRNSADWTSTNTNPHFYFSRGFTGHEHLDAFNLINMNARFYDPVVGRFLSPDNFVQAPENAQNYNVYSYCLNNPLKYTDPSGYWFGWDDLAAAGAGFIVGYVSYGAATDNWWSWKALAAGGIGAAVAWVGWNTLGAGNAALASTGGTGSASSFTSGVSAIFGAKGGFFMSQYATYTFLNTMMHSDQLRATTKEEDDLSDWGDMLTFGAYTASAMLATSLDPSKISNIVGLRQLAGVVLTNNISDNMKDGEFDFHSVHAGPIGYDRNRHDDTWGGLYTIGSKGLSTEQRVDMSFETLLALTSIKSDAKILPKFSKEVNGCGSFLKWKNVPVSKIGFYTRKGYEFTNSTLETFTGRSLYELWYYNKNNKNGSAKY